MDKKAPESLISMAEHFASLRRRYCEQFCGPVVKAIAGTRGVVVKRHTDLCGRDEERLHFSVDEQKGDS